MGKQIGYKQCQEYFNRSPQAFDEIFELSTISITRYNPEVKKSTSLNEFLKRPERYTFDFSTKCTGTTNYKKHVYYYDDLNTAKIEHKKLRLKLYDQQTKPYLNKINKKIKLTTADKDTILQIIDNIMELKPLT